MKKVNMKGPMKDLRTKRDDFFNIQLQYDTKIIKRCTNRKIIRNRKGVLGAYRAQ